MDAATSLLCAVVLSALVPPADDLQRVEAVALANRRLVNTLSLTMRSVSKETIPAEDQYVVNKAIWVAGDRIRVDAVTDRPSLGKFSGKRRVVCLGCERSGHFFDYTQLPHFVATLDSRQQSQKTLDYAGIGTDYRMLGYVPLPVGMFYLERLDGYVGRADRDDLVLTEEVLDGTRCQVVRYSRLGGKVRFGIWYDSDRGMHPIRFLTEEGPPGKATFRSEMRVALQPVGGGLWFPKSTVFTQGSADRVFEEQRVDVTAVTVNAPIPESIFQFKGMDLPEDTLIVVQGANAADYLWRGGRLVPAAEARREWEAKQPAPEPVSLASGQPPRYGLYALAVVLTLAAIVLARRAFREPA